MATLTGDKKKEESYVDLTDETEASSTEEKDKSITLLCQHLNEEVTVHDYCTLEDGEFINDSIINFYLKYLYSKLSEPLQESIHIFSTHFYTSLKGNPGRSNKNDSSPKMTKAEKSYLRVKGWTRKIDIFAKRMLVLPICEDLHWYLLIVCNHGMVLSAKRTKDYEERREEQQKLESMGGNPFIMVLDSMEGTHSSAVNKIRSFLQFEHLERKGFPLSYGSEKMSEKCPFIPLQSNFSDCGVYLLHYAELIFRNPHQFLGAKLPDLSKWFSLTEITNKRRKIADDIKDLAESQGTPLDLFPKIKFPSALEGSESSEGETSPVITSDRNISDPRFRSTSTKTSTARDYFSTSKPLATYRSTERRKKSSEMSHSSKRFRTSGSSSQPRTINKRGDMYRELMKYTKTSK